MIVSSQRHIPLVNFLIDRGDEAGFTGWQKFGQRVKIIAQGFTDLERGFHVNACNTKARRTKLAGAAQDHVPRLPAFHRFGFALTVGAAFALVIGFAFAAW